MTSNKMWQHIDLDGALADVARALGWPTVAARSWGPRLRFCSPAAEMEAFYEWVKPQLVPFTLFGSGDFHHLSALWQRQVTEPYVLLTFDNHPDWDVRPPHWACGGWVNRALENSLVAEAQVWGCGNFELSWPNRLFANHAAMRAGKLTVRPWAERFNSKDQARYQCLTRANWLEEFARQVALWKGKNVYVSVDIDCLAPLQAFTNWENGLFEPGDVAEAIRLLRAGTNVIGGDLCGIYSAESYARWTQKFCAGFDHPSALTSFCERNPEFVTERNEHAIETIWRALINDEKGLGLPVHVPVPF